MSIVIFVVILLVLVLAHEFGHFFAARKFGIRVEEFGFGFPPKLFGFKKGETEYTFNLFPIGGFVKIFGENPDEESISGPDSDRSLVNKAKWKQAIVLFAGIFANFVLAWLLFSVGFMSGLPTSVGAERPGYKLENVNLVVVSILPKSPAEKAGLKIGDKIVNIKFEKNFTSYVSPDTVKSVVVAAGGKEIEMGYIRGQTTEVSIAKVTPVLNPADGQMEIGISMDQIGIAKLPVFPALLEGLRLDWYMAKSTAVGLFTLVYDGIRGKGNFAGVMGPVGMVGIVGDAYQFGFVYLLSFAALISINLAIINLLPFPALDGGRLFFLLIEKIKGSRIKPEIANTVNMIGFGLLILLMLVITYHDVAKLF